MTVCCSERLSNFYVLVSDNPFSSTDLTTTINQAGVSSYYTAGQAGALTEIGVGRSGRYLRVQLAGDNYLSMAEVEVMAGTSSGEGIKWLMTDHLGSTRLVIDQTGSLGGIRRHDFAPFGEELFAGVGIRSASVGYSSDSVRQKFGSNERDDETGLDFLEARYLSSLQGRFTSVDPIFITLGRLVDPQRLNLYAYVRNNPLMYVDPEGMDLEIDAATEKEARKKFELLQKGFKPADRSHVTLIVGNGKNGFAQGKFGVEFDPKHNSKDKGYNDIKAIADDKNSNTILGFVASASPIPTNVTVNQGGKIVVVPLKQSSHNVDFTLEQGWTAQTNFALPASGQLPANFPTDVLMSTDASNRVYVMEGQKDVKMVEDIHHELRSHVFLSNMGRDVPKGRHGAPGVDTAGRTAEREARQNYNRKK